MHENGAPLTEVAEYFDRLSEYFEGECELDSLARANALCVSGIMDLGTTAVLKVLRQGENGVQELFCAPLTTKTFLIHFGRDSKNIALDAVDSWREFFEDVCRRTGDLSIVACGLSLSRERHECSRDFFRELTFWTHLRKS